MISREERETSQLVDEILGEQGMEHMNLGLVHVAGQRRRRGRRHPDRIGANVPVRQGEIGTTSPKGDP